MANSLEFKITAEDQASRTVETVQNKIQNFGRDIAKMALGFAGPLALVQMGFQKISEIMEEQKKKQQELSQAVQSDPIYQQIIAQKEFASSLTETERATLALIEAKKKQIELTEKDKTAREEYTKNFLENTKQGKKIMEDNMLFDPESGATMKASAGMLSRKPEIQKAALEALQAEADAMLETIKLKEREANFDKLKLDTYKEFSDYAAKVLQTQIGISGQGRTQQITARNLADAEANLEKIRAKRLQTGGITVSGLRELGGGVVGESAAIRNQLSQQPSGKSPQELVAEQQVELFKKEQQSFEKFDTVIMKFDTAITKMPTVTGTIDTGFSSPGVNTTEIK